jgi:NAD(P)-dependent dehydrogenase (short-subunit alcohol dehydrogenase family)
MRILVTGGNQGIGFALCKQLAVDHNCHVYLSARSPDKGMSAVEKITDNINQSGSKGSVEFIELDTSNDESVKAAAEKTRARLGSEKLYGIVNNAGIGLNTGMGGDIINTNLYGPKRVIETFFDLLDQEKGRVVNLGSGSGPNYVSGCSIDDKKILCSPESVTWEYIEQHAKDKMNSGVNVYGLSKALLSCYTCEHYLFLCVSWIHQYSNDFWLRGLEISRRRNQIDSALSAR